MMNAVRELQGRSGHWRAILTEEWQLVRDYCAAVGRGEAPPAHPLTRIETVTPESLAQAGIPLPGIDLFLPAGAPREALHVKSARYEAWWPPPILHPRFSAGSGDGCPAEQSGPDVS